jgi:transposase
LIYPENIGTRISIDETSFTNGELYTIITNKAAKGKGKSLIAMIKGVKSSEIIKILAKISLTKREQVEEVTLDMAANMNLIVRQSFPKASKVIDRFHVQKMAFEAVQDIRIKHRWEAIDTENEEITRCRKEKIKYVATLYDNGDSPKQLLARSRYILYKNETKWTEKQKLRSEILFKEYPDIKKAYNLSQKLSFIYQTTFNKDIARTKLAQWIELVRQSEFKAFNTTSNTINNHYTDILNYFDNRSTNAAAESFNAKIKAFRLQLRGIRDVNFFLFRLEKLFS